VLWHPEEGEDYALFAALVEEAAAYRLSADRATGKRVDRSVPTDAGQSPPS